MKPTASQFHIGNYYGAVRPLFELVHKYKEAEVFFMIATMHAFTNFYDGSVLSKNVVSCWKMYLAMMRVYWLDDHSLLIFNQPDVVWHAQLAWVFQCITHMGFLERMHAYKDAASKGRASELSVGTFCYPVLQAVDVILYDVDYVPVGKDQQQHIEYARDIAQKFNSLFWETFVLPECLLQADVEVVPWIDGRKMSKSYNNFIGLLDDEKLLLKKIRRIPTSALPVEASKNPDECNVYNILKLFLSLEENDVLRQRYLSGWLSFKEVKDFLYEKIRFFVKPIQDHYASISDDVICKLLKKNATVVSEIANKKILDVYKKVGFSSSH